MTNIALKSAISECHRLATNRDRPGKATYDCVVIECGTRMGPFVRPYMVQRRDTQRHLNPNAIIAYDPVMVSA